jgi:hypothetical protein
MSTPSSRFEGERAELAAVLTSGIFDRSPNLYRFLSFVCEKYFRGEGDAVKEYSVAIEALGRGADFDQKRDSIVRVEAHRLRKRLDDYYRSEGANHRYRIILPAGSYVPQFIDREESIAAPEDSEHPPAGAMESQPAGNAEVLEAIEPPQLVSAPTPGPPPPANLPPMPSPLAAASQRFPVGRGIAILSVLLLVVAAAFTWNEMNRSTAKSVEPEPTAFAASSIARSPSLDAEGETGIRIMAGSSISSFVDRFGHTWTGDAYFSGGTAVETRLRTLHFTSVPEIYAYRREGEFSYDIPVPPGNYELRLHFVEPIFGMDKLAGGGETSRLFNVDLNGERVLTSFDIVADAFGDDCADIKVFRDVRPASDGKVHLRFTAGQHESPILSALELVPSHPGRMNPVRIVASDRGFYDGQGNLWQADNYVLGGRTVRRSPVELPGVDGNLFASERYGNFSYMVPVAVGGKYRVRLHFCERWFGPNTHAGGGKGSRVFDVTANGRALLTAFDIFEQAGATDIPIVKEFAGIEANAQGKLILQFIPRENYALINAIEVIDDGK